MEKQAVQATDTQGDIRLAPRRTKLPCGAPYCFRCHEECGVLVAAYIDPDLFREEMKNLRKNATASAPTAK